MKSWELACVAVTCFMHGKTEAQEVKSPQVTVPSVGSVGQQGGATVGYVGSFTQNVLPTLVRGPLLDTFKARYVEGAQILRASRNAPTDADLKNCVDAANNWMNGVYSWLNTSVSPWAAERFAFTVPLSMNWGWAGEHSQDMKNQRDSVLNQLPPLLQNLDQLMREPSIYPEHDLKKP